MQNFGMLHRETFRQGTWAHGQKMETVQRSINIFMNEGDETTSLFTQSNEPEFDYK